MTINRTLIERIDKEIGAFYNIDVWRRNISDDLHVHMMFVDDNAFEQAVRVVEQNGATNINTTETGRIKDLRFLIPIHLRSNDIGPLDLLVTLYRKNRPEPNEWDP